MVQTYRAAAWPQQTIYRACHHTYGLPSAETGKTCGTGFIQAIIALQPGRGILSQGTPGETYDIGEANEKTDLEAVKTVCGILDELRPLLADYVC